MDPELAEVCSLERRLLDPAVRRRPDEVRRQASKRSSLWVHGDDGRQVRFHQGTPT